jgi:cytochrome P450
MFIVSGMTQPAVVPLDTDEYWADPYPILNELRDRHRTAVTPTGQKVVLRWDDAEAVKKRPEFVNDGLEFIEERGFKPGDALYEWRRWSISTLNGNEHRRLRSLVNRALTPKSVDRVRPVVRRHTLEVLERHAGAGELDARSAFRHVPFLSMVFFLGVDDEEAEVIWPTMAGGSGNEFGPAVTQEIRDQANARFAAVLEFGAMLVENRRREPRDDLLTRLIEVEEDGDRMSYDELVVLFTNIFGGAVETTSSMMTSTVLELARHPDQSELLRKHPDELKRGATEEILRHRPAFYAIGQNAAVPTELAGVRFEKKEQFSIIVGGPNRDPSRWDDPNRFDITRDPSMWPFTFSMGPHFCLGQALARAELQEFSATIAAQCHDLELTAEPKWQPRVMVNTVDQLPIRYAFREGVGQRTTNVDSRAK